jgi:glycogen debranching enzyme
MSEAIALPAAGLPWFMAPFGRDGLIASLKCITVYPEFARGALQWLGSLQATEMDDDRDAEPGKIMHELRSPTSSSFPSPRIYGTADATPLWLTTLHATWLATGDVDLLKSHMKTAEACLAWIHKYGDQDGNGLKNTRRGHPPVMKIWPGRIAATPSCTPMVRRCAGRKLSASYQDTFMTLGSA